MNVQGKSNTTISLIIFSLGVIFSLIFISIAVWGDLEASLFDSSIREEASIKSYKCPIMITTRETGIIRARFTNPTEREIERAIQTNISEGHVTLMRRIDTKLPLAPGASEELEYTVFPEDAAFGRFIFARTHVLRSAPLPSQSSACGILVIDLPLFTGGQIVGMLLGTAIIGMVSGLGLWFKSNYPLRRDKTHQTYSMLLLMVVLLFGIIASIASQWILGLAAIIGALFLMVELIAYSAMNS